MKNQNSTSEFVTQPMRYGIMCLFLSVLMSVGCGSDSGPTLVAVQGTVTSNGTPVPGLFITFLPQEGRPSWAISDDEGHYEAHYTTTKDGVLPGPCKVWVTFKPTNMEQEMAIVNGQNPFGDWTDLLSKYGSEETSALNLTVSGSEPNVDLKLDY